MKQTLTATDLYITLRECYGCYFSYGAAEALLEYYDDIDEEMECDPIAINCEWTEYDVAGIDEEIDHFFDDYSYLLEKEEDETDDDYFLRLIDELETRTDVLRCDNGSYLVREF